MRPEEGLTANKRNPELVEGCAAHPVPQWKGNAFYGTLGP
ncbi:hypothetical protein U91I_03308 [alpha proteobacterium U9-1i]|nr:hypothetical protein U91I_03308 [alpha proteobacterium U9-1i]